MSGDWRLRASCRGTDARVFFSRSRQTQGEAQRMCRRCPVRQACLESALKAEQGADLTRRFGVFGGTTPKQRLAMAKGK